MYALLINISEKRFIDTCIVIIAVWILIFYRNFIIQSFPGTHTLTVTASDGTNSITATVSVVVNDINDNIPTCTTPLYYEVAEDTTAGVTVVDGAHYTCTDADSGVANSLIQYSMTAGDFTIDMNTGTLVYPSQFLESI